MMPTLMMPMMIMHDGQSIIIQGSLVDKPNEPKTEHLMMADQQINFLLTIVKSVKACVVHVTTRGFCEVTITSALSIVELECASASHLGKMEETTFYENEASLQ